MLGIGGAHIKRICFSMIMTTTLTGASACNQGDSTPEGGDAGDGGLGAMPPATGSVEAPGAEALNEGNRALQCDDAVDQRARALLAEMTPSQKIAEMHGAAAGTVDGFWQAGGDTSLGIPPFKMSDGPRGVAVNAGSATAFPVGMARGATWDPELERRVGIPMGLELAAKGGNMILAPTINLLRHPGWGRAQETYSEDPFHMGRMALGFIGGAQNHVLASAKHFDANSVEDTRFTMSADMDERTLREVYLPHFRVAVEVAHVASVMSAYNRVNGTYCAENEHLLRDILKGDWAFSGFVESDWVLGTRSTVPSALAGLDIEMPSPVYYGPPLLDAVQSGDVPESVVDEAVLRILKRKVCFSLDKPEAVDPGVVENDEHRALAREVAEQSMVLLKNAGGLLPLSEDIETIAVVGQLSDTANLGDQGSSSVSPTTSVSPLAGLEARIGAERIVSITTDAPSAEELSTLDGLPVAVVVAGLTYQDEGENIPGGQGGGDRAHLGLHDDQVALIEAVSSRVKHTIVVLEGGSAIIVRPWVDSVEGLLMAWYPGTEGGAALARLLFGDVNPSGRLPVTFARNEADYPPWDITSERVEYGYLHGYRLLDEEGREPEYAFGFGLSYSRSELGRLELDRVEAGAGDTVTVSVDVYNRGAVAMDEVVQVYASAPDSAVARAPKILVGFVRLALDPGEVKTARIPIDVEAHLSHWDVDAAAWALESTDWTLRVGKSSRDLPLTASLRVD